MMDLNVRIQENAPQQAPQAEDEEPLEFIPIGMTEPDSSSS
jgi:hypothetical protein